MRTMNWKKKYWDLEVGSLSSTLNFTSHSHFEGFFFLVFDLDIEVNRLLIRLEWEVDSI